MICVLGMLIIAFLEFEAITHGIDGIALASSFGGLCGIVGYWAGVKKKELKKKQKQEVR